MYPCHVWHGTQSSLSPPHDETLRPRLRVLPFHHITSPSSVSSRLRLEHLVDVLPTILVRCLQIMQPLAQFLNVALLLLDLALQFFCQLRRRQRDKPLPPPRPRVSDIIPAFIHLSSCSLSSVEGKGWLRQAGIYQSRVRGLTYIFPTPS